MTLRWIAIPTAVGLAFSPMLAPPAAAAQIARPRPVGFTIPLEIDSAAQGGFAGTLRILGFSVENGQLVAVGLVSGSRVDEATTITSIVRTVKLPASAGTPGTPTPPAPAPPSPDPGTSPDPQPTPPGDEEPAPPPAEEPGMSAQRANGPMTSATCQTLHLELGPLELDVLGTPIRVERVVFDIDPLTRGAIAVLCGTEPLQGSDRSPIDVARKLNRLVAALN